MADELAACGHDVQVLASETSLSDADESYETPDNVHFYPAFKIGTKTVLNRLRNNWSEKAGSERVARGLGRFDIVVVTSPPLMLTMSGIRIARKAGAKLVFDVRDIWPDVAYEMGSFKPCSLYGVVFSRLAKRAYKEAALITTVTEGKTEKLSGQLPPRDAAKVHLVPNGLDVGFLEAEERSDVVERYKLDENPPCVYIGNLGLAQGLTSLLDIAEERPAKRFLLFGSGAEERLLVDEVARRSLPNVELCGRIDARGAFTLLKHAACAYVSLKSSCMTDSVPTKLYEALGCGCPVLLAAQGDSAVIVEECGLGVVAPPEDHKALLRAFDEVTDSDWTEERKATAGRSIVANHSRQAAARKFAQIVETLYGGHG
ncbi:glycosyltransferase family 4 protein [Arabiibacter massiliensis]|uniref:glycosyltransferase family 4 protein n=1 Tax=Arabiibacter massiliensis TaxID=1870985 RepID=UPI00155B0530|nr:glycosyltransferase family 4 protein [Arabiibacter massiliensis]